MELISSFVRTEVQIESIGREEDELVMHGTTLDMPSQLYVSPNEIGSILRLALSWPSFTYAVLFPFLYLKWYLSQSDLETRLAGVAVAVSLLFSGALVFGSSDYLVEHAAESAAVLGLFAALCLVLGLVGERRSLFYSGLGLAVAAYLLALVAAGAMSWMLPTAALAAVGLLGLLGWCCGRRGEADEARRFDPRRMLFRVGAVVALLFAVWGMWSLWSATWRSDGHPVVTLVAPLLGAAAFFEWRFLAGARGAGAAWLPHRYLAVGLGSLGYTLGLWLLPPAAQGLRPLLLAGGGMLWAGLAVREHGRAGGRAAGARYAAGLILAVVALLAALGQPSLMLLTCILITAASFPLAGSLHARRGSVAGAGAAFWWLFIAGHLAAALAAFLLLASALRTSTLGWMGSFLLALLYGRLAMWRLPTALRGRSQYLFIAAAFYTWATLSALLQVAPSHTFHLKLLLGLPLLGVLLGCGARFRSEELSRSCREASHAFVAALFIAAGILEGSSLSWAALHSLAFGALYSILVLRARGRPVLDLSYFVIVLAAYLLAALGAALALHPVSRGMLFALLGLLALLQEVRLRRRGSPWQALLTVAVLTAAGLSLYEVLFLMPWNIAALMLWAVAFLLGALALPAAPSTAAPQVARQGSRP